MENILKRAWAEVSLGRARKNYQILSSMLNSPHTRPMCVVKANAYGHGDIEMMELYQSIGAGFFGVSNLNEAVRLRENGCRGEIIILSWSPPDKEVAAALYYYNIISTIVSPEHARELSANAEKPVRVHIKIDTGMGRVGLDGFNTEQCAGEILKIKALENISAEGAFTHFAVADSAESSAVDYTNAQKQRFFAVLGECERRGVSFETVHFTNSAGAVLHGDTRSGLARLGITLYGLKPDSRMIMPGGITPVMELKACVSQVKTVKAGQTVGYGRTYTAEKETRVATIPVGYADGYPRLLSNKSDVIIKGKRARCIGRICMDQMTVDVSNIPDVRMGDIVTLIGSDGNETITSESLAAICGTIGYETVSSVSSRVPRIYIENN